MSRYVQSSGSDPDRFVRSSDQLESVRKIGFLMVLIAIPILMIVGYFCYSLFRIDVPAKPLPNGCPTGMEGSGDRATASLVVHTLIQCERAGQLSGPFLYHFQSMRLRVETQKKADTLLDNVSAYWVTRSTTNCWPLFIQSSGNCIVAQSQKTKKE
jgi:hypothetical protein